MLPIPRLRYTPLGLLIIGLACAVGLVAARLTATAAPVSAARVVVASPCTSYGHLLRIAGDGWKPGMRVQVSFPVSTPGPRYRLPDAAVMADGRGGIAASVRVFHLRGPRYAHEVRLVLASGRSIGGGAATSLAGFLLGTERLCRALRGLEAPAGR